MDFNKLTQKSLDDFKVLFPDDKKLQALTLDELVSYSTGKHPSGLNARRGREPKVKELEAELFSPCHIAIAVVVVDCILVVAGAFGLHGKIRASAIRKVAKVIEPEMVEIEKIAKVLADPHASNFKKAKAMFSIGKLIYSAGMLGAVFKAIVKSLTWWDMVLYGVAGMAELVAAFATEGAAIIALIVAEIAQVGFVVSDSVKMVNACR
ncbi:MAG: hypothetical protein PHP88_07055 [bacterium]|nr:hypothetical protein [bacterium]